MQIVGKEGIKVSRIVQKQILEPGAPLLPDSRGGRKNDAGGVQPTDQLQTQHGLAATGGGHDMNLAVRKIFMAIWFLTALLHG